MRNARGDGDGGGPTTRLLLVTANVGSLFEQYESLCDGWLGALVATVRSAGAPHLVAVHMQEVGGKKAGGALVARTFDALATALSRRMRAAGYDRSFAYYDDDAQRAAAPATSTALGVLCFVHSTLGADEAHVFDSAAGRFVPCPAAGDGAACCSRSLAERARAFVSKERFPAEFNTRNPTFRKGFAASAWRFKRCGGTARNVMLVNVHLFHDESNLHAIQECPSRYANLRTRAMEHVLRRVAADLSRVYPEEEDGAACDTFLFGDFNFRLDAKPLLQHLLSAIAGDRVAERPVAPAALCNGLMTVASRQLSLDDNADKVQARSTSVEDSTDDTETVRAGGDGDDVQAGGRKRSSTQPMRQFVCSNTGQPMATVGRKLFEFHPGAALGHGRSDSDPTAGGGGCSPQSAPSSAECYSSWLLAEWRSLRRFDAEADRLRQSVAGGDRLREAPVDFPPTYPLSESPVECGAYLRTRPPAWCDRVLLLRNDDGGAGPPVRFVQYDVVGAQEAMGDHKPVFLLAEL